MVSRDTISERKGFVMRGAAERWRIKAPEVARAIERLAVGGPIAAASPARAAAYVAREASGGGGVR